MKSVAKPNLSHHISPRMPWRVVGGVVVAMVLLAVVVQPIFASIWQATYQPFYHKQQFCGTVDVGGQEDAGVVYESGQRHVYAEGSYLQWSSGAIGCLQYGLYQQNPTVEGAVVFHAFNKDTSNCNALSWLNGWAWSNLPSVSIDSKTNGCEVRFYIGAPNNMSSTSTYYSQLAYNDTAYPSTKTIGQVTESTYLVQLFPLVPWFRDDNAKLCINSDTAYTPNNGNCLP